MIKRFAQWIWRLRLIIADELMMEFVIKRFGQ